MTDNRLETRLIGETPESIEDLVHYTIQHFAMRDDSAENSGRLAGTMRVGVSTPCYQVHLSGLVGGLTQTDANFVATQYGTTTTKQTHYQYGLDGVASHGPYVFQTEIYKGQFSILPITGYSVLGGFQPGGEKSRRYYLRYSAINNGLSPTTGPEEFDLTPLTAPGNFNPALTWNVQQLTFGLIQPIARGVWAELEYEHTKSPPTGANPLYVPGNADMLFVEFFTGF